MPPSRGSLDLLFLAGPGHLGGRLEYAHKLSRQWAMFGAGAIDRIEERVGWSAEFGARGRW